MPRDDTQPPPTRLKLPACDSCKYRRVRCDSVPPPASCSRCIAKGIRCTTTPVVRKPRERTGKRIEEAKAMHGSSHIVTRPSPIIRAEDAMVDLEVTGDLVAHLLLLYTHTPRAQFFPCFRMMAAFESAGRRLASLPPRSQTLALAIAATAARISSHPVLLGSGPAPPALSTFFFDPMLIAEDLTYDFGRRRENACKKLHQLALEQAWESSVLEANGQEALETCYLLYALENRGLTDRTTNIWATSFVSVLRLGVAQRQIHTFDPETGSYKLPYCPSAPPPRQVSLNQLNPPIQQLSLRESRTADANVTMKTSPPPNPSNRLSVPPESLLRELFWYEEYPGPSGMAIRWSINIMQESLACAAYGNICPYTLQDEVMLAGPPPPAPQEVLTDEDALGTFQWWDTQTFFAVVRPYTYHITQIALNSFDWNARRRSGLPFSMARLKEHMAALKPLHALLSLAHTRFAVAFGPEATAMRLNANYADTDQQASAINRREFSDRQNACLILGAMINAMAHVNIPIWVDVETRLRSSKSVDDAAKRELEQVMVGLKRALLPYACRTVVEDWQGAGGRTTIAWLTLRCWDFSEFWTSVILKSVPIEDGGEGLTRAEKLEALETIMSVYKAISWSWPRTNDSTTASQLRNVVGALKLERMFDQLYETGGTPSSQGSNHSNGTVTLSARTPAEMQSKSSNTVSFDLPDVETVVRASGALGESMQQTPPSNGWSGLGVPSPKDVSNLSALCNDYNGQLFVLQPVGQGLDDTWDSPWLHQGFA